jgi:transposase
LLFEGMVVELARSGLTVNALARIVGEHDTRMWRVLEYHVVDARRWADFSQVKAVRLDETSQARGHVYVTVFVDMGEHRVLFVTPGKDSSTLAAFKADFELHGGNPAAIEDFSLDMSKAFVKGIHEQFPDAQLTFDPFHVIKLMNEAVNKVWRAERVGREELKKTRMMWLKNPENHTPTEAERFQLLKDTTLKSARAYRIREQLQCLYDEQPDTAAVFFKRWYSWATHSRLEPVIKVAKTLKAHQDGILRHLKSGLSNGLLEGFNSLIQAAKARARGFRSPEKMATIIYLLLAKLDFRLPQAFPSATH